MINILISLFSLVVTQIELQKLSNFEVEFNSSCQTYLNFHGPGWNYVNLIRKQNTLELYLMDNNSWEFYVAPWIDNFTFSWPEKLVNNKPMVKIKSNGYVKLPKTLIYKTSNCTINGLTTGKLSTKPSNCEVFKCPNVSSKDLWWKIFIAVSASVLILTLFLSVSAVRIKDLVQRFKFSRSNERMYSSRV